MALFIFSINLPRVSTRGYNMFRADGPLNILSPQIFCRRRVSRRGPCDGLQLYTNGAQSRAHLARGAGSLSGDPARTGMADDIKPANSHIALANVGNDLKIVRDNMPFGNMSTNEMGTYFIAYASTFTTVQKMLNNMFIGSPAGNYNRILDFSTAKTGSLFFVPTFNMVNDFAG